MQGGGIPEDSLEQVFQYGYTTVDDGELSAQVPSHAIASAHWTLRRGLSAKAYFSPSTSQPSHCCPLVIMLWLLAEMHCTHGLLGSHAQQRDFHELHEAGLRVQGQDEGAVWAQMAERAASPGGPWRMGGLGFGLPLSRLYARYFGKLPFHGGRQGELLQL